MNPYLTSNRIIITCNKRLSTYLEKEVVELGFTPVRTFVTGVEIFGTMNDCIILNLNLRCASQVLYALEEFPANSPDEVYDALIKFPWETLLAPDGYFTITSQVNHFTVNNELFINVKVKDAIADRMRRETMKRPDSGSDSSKSVVHLYWKENHATVFIDTSGETLAKHGYRKIPGKAPMLEALAAATIMASQWDHSIPFVNPMCGSSTLAIEAILIATNRRPGLFRKNYSFMHFLPYDPSVYYKELKKLQEKVKELPNLHIIASDVSKDAIDISKINAGIAGVESLIHFQVCDFGQTEIPPPPGVIFVNPEYGERMGEISKLEVTYERLGDFMKKKCQGYMGYIFTGNMELAKKIGLKANKRIEFYSAKLDCRLLEYEMYVGTKRVPKPAEEAS